MTHPLRTVIAITVVSLSALACGRPFDVNTPRGFVEIDEGGVTHDYRAIAADGVVVGVRAIDVDDRGTLDFWEQAVTVRLRDVGGYKLLQRADVSSEDGTAGRHLRFGHDQDGKSYLYRVTLFRAQGRLYVLEAGGREQLLARHDASLDWQASSFRARCGFPGAPVVASRTCNRW